MKSSIQQSHPAIGRLFVFYVRIHVTDIVLRVQVEIHADKTVGDELLDAVEALLANVMLSIIV